LEIGGLYGIKHEGFVELKNNPNLISLIMDDLAIMNDELIFLKEMKKLTNLSLTGCFSLNDDALDIISSLENLKMIQVFGTQFSEGGKLYRF